MSFRKKVCAFVLLVCLIPSFALAANKYNSTKIYSGEISTEGIVFKSGDKLTGGSRISVEVNYADAMGNIVAEGNGTIKTVTIDGEKVSKWVMKSKNGAIIQIGNIIYQAAYGFTMIPEYAAADSEGYYIISEKTHQSYLDTENSIGKNVKLTGHVIAKEADFTIVSIADGINTAIKTNEVFQQDDRINCKGTIFGTTTFNTSEIPVVECIEAIIQPYDPLEKGDAGAEVFAMKERLQALGYFTANAKLSDAYNDTCVERIKQFQKNNGLPVTGNADSSTLTLLYSDAAKSK